MSTGDDAGREPASPQSASTGSPATGRPAGVPASTPSAGAAAGIVFDDPLDRPSADDAGRGWGDPPAGTADDDFTRFLNEKPPHHL